MASRTVAGSCLCGAVRFEVALPTLFCAHCHCRMCRRSHGAAYVTWIGVPRAQLRLAADGAEPVTHASSDHGTRSFCGRCGSSLFCESKHHPDVVDVVLANMSGPIDREPQLHFYFDDRASWVVAEDGLPRLPGGLG